MENEICVRCGICGAELTGKWYCYRNWKDNTITIAVCKKCLNEKKSELV